MEIVVTPETVAIASEILIDGQMTDFNGNKVPPFEHCFELSETVTAKHILWESFVDKTGCRIPKLFGYLVMDKVW